MDVLNQILNKEQHKVQLSAFLALSLIIMTLVERQGLGDFIYNIYKMTSERWAKHQGSGQRSGQF